MSNELTPEEWMEEYNDFVKMGLTQYEIARAFNLNIESMEARIRRFRKRKAS